MRYLQSDKICSFLSFGPRISYIFLRGTVQIWSVAYILIIHINIIKIWYHQRVVLFSSVVKLPNCLSYSNQQFYFIILLFVSYMSMVFVPFSMYSKKYTLEAKNLYLKNLTTNVSVLSGYWVSSYVWHMCYRAKWQYNIFFYFGLISTYQAHWHYFITTLLCYQKIAKLHVSWRTVYRIDSKWWRKDEKIDNRLDNMWIMIVLGI